MERSKGMKISSKKCEMYQMHARIRTEMDAFTGKVYIKRKIVLQTHTVNVMSHVILASAHLHA